MTVARAIMDDRGDRVLGMMLIELDPDMFSNLLLGNQGLFQYQYLFIVDQKGRGHMQQSQGEQGMAGGDR